ncbi:hypothetical protein chiPu_0016106 [Chiloscyllium punctatum]|uniref:Uncharacterized protein n=1 Tax=Chiloscyllium punctatum TaxID=137246 RepID=A0A401T4Q5_CHIPU|nr:hypothetical protein [Chiloscyllium punctatum]
MGLCLGSESTAEERQARLRSEKIDRVLCECAKQEQNMVKILLLVRAAFELVTRWRTFGSTNGHVPVECPCEFLFLIFDKYPYCFKQNVANRFFRFGSKLYLF